VAGELCRIRGCDCDDLRVTQFLRFQATVPNRRGIRPVIFALVNGLARDGRLQDEELAWLREDNAWYDTQLYGSLNH
jgi:hypothetical protein